MKTSNENPIAVLRGIVATARAQANREREGIRTERLKAERQEIALPDGVGPIEAARLAQEHDQRTATLRNLERRFDVVARTEEILNADNNLSLLKGAAAHLAKIARTTKPQRPTPRDDDAPKPLHPVPKGGLFGVPEMIPVIERLATAEGWISAWPAHSFSTIARELMAIEEQLQVSAKLPHPEPFRASYPQRACV
jgi:hypothetical protein